MLVSSAVRNNIDKFILVSSMFVTKPESLWASFLNFMVKDVMGNKLKAENMLR